MAKRRTAKKRGKTSRVTTMNVSMPSPMRKFVEERVSSEGFGNASEFIRDLVREKQRRIEYERRRLVRMIRDGIESGPGVEITEEWWDKKKAEWTSQRTQKRKAG